MKDQQEIFNRLTKLETFIEAFKDNLEKLLNSIDKKVDVVSKDLQLIKQNANNAFNLAARNKEAIDRIEKRFEDLEEDVTELEKLGAGHKIKITQSEKFIFGLIGAVGSAIVTALLTFILI